jgi:hypothetical protein
LPPVRPGQPLHQTGACRHQLVFNSHHSPRVL